MSVTCNGQYRRHIYWYSIMKAQYLLRLGRFSFLLLLAIHLFFSAITVFMIFPWDMHSIPSFHLLHILLLESLQNARDRQPQQRGCSHSQTYDLRLSIISKSKISTRRGSYVIRWQIEPAGPSCSKQRRHRLWKGFHVIRELPETESVNRENRCKTAVIHEIYIYCEAWSTDLSI